MDVCETPNRPYLRAVNHDTKTVVIFQPRCKLWSCPACARVNRDLWSWRAHHGVNALEARKPQFVTLTLPGYVSGISSLQRWRSGWRTLQKRAKRAAPGLQFFLVTEWQKRGAVHGHAITSEALTERFWKDNAAECGLGFIADESPLYSPHYASIYVAKYLTKQMAEFWPRGWRRVRTSRGWPKLPDLVQTDGWSVATLNRHDALSDVIERAGRARYEVVVTDYASAYSMMRSSVLDR